MPVIQEISNQVSLLFTEYEVSSGDPSVCEKLTKELEELIKELHLEKCSTSTYVIQSVIDFLKRGKTNSNKWKADCTAIAKAFAELAGNKEKYAQLGIPCQVRSRLVLKSANNYEWGAHADLILFLYELQDRLPLVKSGTSDVEVEWCNNLAKLLKQIKLSALRYSLNPVSNAIDKVVVESEGISEEKPNFHERINTFISNVQAAFDAGINLLNENGLNEDSLVDFTSLIVEQLGSAVPDFDATQDDSPGNDVLFYEERFENTDPESDGEIFGNEAAFIIADCEAGLKALRSDLNNQDAQKSLLDSLGTLKGLASWYDQGDIANLANNSMMILNRVVNQAIALDDQMLDLVEAGVLGIVSLREKSKETNRQAEVESVPPIVQATPIEKPIVEIKETLVAAKEVVEPKVAPEPEDANNSSEPKPEPVKAMKKVETPAPAAPVADKAPKAKIQVNENVKVDRERLDQLIDLIGELVIAESMVNEEIESLNVAESTDSRKMGQLRKITRELQELSLSLRMVPIQGTFQKMNRLVRDLSKKMNKQIKMDLVGAETELDKTVVDKVADPLMHIVRNSVDHGIEETAEDRVKAGKPAAATVTLRAYYQGGNIYVEVEDDGRGLDSEKILAKAIEKGIVSPEDKLTESEIQKLIFAAGFSTAAAVTSVSGRGVGMDVVRRNIEMLRGSVEIKSELGKGTVISLRLPLTLAIIDGMTVKVGENRYIIPTPSIVEQIRPKADDIGTVMGQGEILSVRGRHVPFHRLANSFNEPTGITDPCNAIVVLVEHKDNLAGLLVDEIIGQQQVVIKSLGNSLEGLPGLSGGAVMPDGRVGIILDVPGLLEHIKLTSDELNNNDTPVEV